MKRFVLLLIASVSILTTITAQTGGSKFKPAGKWQYEAPTAPEGYTYGSFEIVLTENTYSATMGLPGVDFKLPADEVKFINEALTFRLMIEGDAILVTLKPDGPDSMSGKAVSSGGEIPLTCKREKEKK